MSDTVMIKLPGIPTDIHRILARYWQEENLKEVLDWVRISIQSLYWVHTEMHGTVAKLDRDNFCMAALKIGCTIQSSMTDGVSFETFIARVGQQMQETGLI